LAIFYRKITQDQFKEGQSIENILPNLYYFNKIKQLWISLGNVSLFPKPFLSQWMSGSTYARAFFKVEKIEWLQDPILPTIGELNAGVVKFYIAANSISHF
jgi:hypothetical protein